MAVSASAQSGDPAGFPDCPEMPADRREYKDPATVGGDLPLLDETTLDDLAEELGGQDVARKFARDYAAMWGQRQRRLTVSVEHADLAAALDAVISLRVTSAMVGGSRLAYLARKMEALIREGNLQDAAALLVLIAAHGSATVEQLQRRYDRIPG